ncbi:hypothetical protein G6F46_012048 [Rhizopus delemar]|nr:hypothetical protein G6F46_012048 [Rhizopus delemar]
MNIKSFFKRLLPDSCNLLQIIKASSISIFQPKLAYRSANYAAVCAALLVHNDYAPELKEHLKKFRIQVKEDFDPCDGSILKDPKYENSSNEERDNMAYMHHCNRMERALTYIRPPVKFAVARYFYEQGWIGKSLFDEIVTSHRPQFTEPLCIEDDDEMAIENPLDRLSEL